MESVTGSVTGTGATTNLSVPPRLGRLAIRGMGRATG